MKVVIDVGRVIMLHVGPHVLVIEHKVNFVVEQGNRVNCFALFWVALGVTKQVLRQQVFVFVSFYLLFQFLVLLAEKVIGSLGLCFSLSELCKHFFAQTFLVAD